MGTCPTCHQAIPKTCRACGELIVFREGKPVSWQNHFKVCRPAGKVKPVVHVGKKSIVTEAETASFDAAVEKALQSVKGGSDGQG